MFNSSLLKLVIFLLFISNGLLCQNINWNSRKKLPDSFRNGSAAECLGKVYFMGGYCNSTPEIFEKSNYEYDPITDIWKPKTNMPTGHSNFALVTVKDKIYAIGGDPFSSQNEVYDTKTDTWKTLKPMLTPRQHISCAAVKDKIYIIGGLIKAKDNSEPSSWNYENITNINEMYDPASDMWKTLAPMPTRRHGARMAAVNGKIYVIGGMGDSKDIWKSLSVVEVYDPNLDSWEEKASLPEPRDGFGISVIGDRIFVIGGFSLSGIVNTVYVYDPQKDIWSTATEFPNIQNGSSGCASIGNKIFVMSGCDTSYVSTPYTFEGVVNFEK